jgi:antitoxin component HigA of HigAB toxin-antitoxin module
MKAIPSKQIEIKLVMNEAEATWLMSYMQNWLASTPENEESKTMRFRIFEALEDAFNHIHI